MTHILAPQGIASSKPEPPGSNLTGGVESPSILLQVQIDFIEDLYGKNYTICRINDRISLLDHTARLGRPPEVILQNDKVYVLLNIAPKLCHSDYFDLLLWCNEFCSNPYGIYGLCKLDQTGQITIPKRSISMMMFPEDITALLLSTPDPDKIKVL